MDLIIIQKNEMGEGVSQDRVSLYGSVVLEPRKLSASASLVLG